MCSYDAGSETGVRPSLLGPALAVFRKARALVRLALACAVLPLSLQAVVVFVIQTQPSSQSVQVGADVTFTVTAAGGGSALTYQWRFNGAAISGATSSTYTILNVQTSHAGNYDVVVSSGLTSVTSEVAVLSVSIPELLINGSFESGYSGWSASGNQAIVTSTAYGFTDGVKAVGFNVAQQAPNGVLAQTFATTPGQGYQLAFDLGAFSLVNKAEQRLLVTVQGSATLASQTLSVFAPGNWTRYVAQRIAFVADSSATTLTYRDVSLTSENVDVLLDHIRVTSSGCRSPFKGTQACSLGPFRSLPRETASATQPRT